MPAKTPSGWGMGCLMLFATPFVLGGVLMLSAAIRGIAAGRASASA